MSATAPQSTATARHGDTLVEITNAEAVPGATFRPHSLADGLTHLTITAPASEGPVTLSWRVPAGDALSYWTADSRAFRGIHPDWASPHVISPFSGVPIGVLYDTNGFVVAAWALAEQTGVVVVGGGLEEETGLFRLDLEIPRSSNREGISTVLRMDTRHQRFDKAVTDIGQWWRESLGSKAFSTPDIAYHPVYSTWYSFHQELEQAELEAETNRASALGFKTVIVDDGWQTTDTGRGYAFTGDWHVSTERFPDLGQLVRSAEGNGISYMLWVAVPLIGKGSAAAQRFPDRLLNWNKELGMWIFDIRYRDARQYLLNACIDLVTRYSLAGLKIDFVDLWLPPTIPAAGPDADIRQLEDAVDTFLQELSNALETARPGTLIEFRQNYVGPRMWRYANLFRAADCPFDRITNRVQTIDLRLMLADRAVHTDPIMWDSRSSVQAAAEQILNGIFAVPQISMNLEQLTDEESAMIRHWLDFAHTHRETLYKGTLEVTTPDTNYAVARAHGPRTTIVAAYGRTPVALTAQDRDHLILLNATGSEELIVDVHPEQEYEVVELHTTTGNEVARRGPSILKGLQRITVPRAGSITIRRVRLG